MRIPVILFVATFFLSISSSFSQITSCNLQANPIITGAGCDNACNGSVRFEPSGGVAPYTFNAFDHNFPGTSIDQTKFDVLNGGFSVANNQLNASPVPNSTTEFANSVSTKQTFPDNGKLVVEGSIFSAFNSFAIWGLAANQVVSDPDHFPYAVVFVYGELYLITEGVWSKIENYSANTWFDIKIEKTGTIVNYYIRNTGVATYRLLASKTASEVHPAYKIAAAYYDFMGSYGGFSTKNWRVGGNPPTTDLCPGTYVYTVYDAVGCSATATVTIGVAAGTGSLQLTGATEGVSCQTSNDGAVNLNVSGGQAPYTYGFAFSFTSGSSINEAIFDLRNGNFSQGVDLRNGINVSSNNSWDNSISTRQTLSDGGFMTFQASFKFDQNSEVLFGYTNTGIINEFSDVFFGFRVAGGNSLFAYDNLSGGLSLGSIIPNQWYDFKIEKTGSTIFYYTRVTGSGNFVLRATKQYITNNVEYKVAALNFASFSSASGGYNTTGWSAQSNPRVASLAPGTYTYTITDAAGCSATAVVNVAQSSTASVTLAATVATPANQGSANGVVSLSPSLGVAPYKYKLEEAFSSAAINESMLSVRNGAFSQGGGDLRSNVLTGNNSSDNTISTRISFPGAYITYEGSFRFDNNATVYFGLTPNAAVINNLNQVDIGFVVINNQLFTRSGLTNRSIGAVTPGTWIDFKVEKVGNTVRYYSRNSGSYSLIATMSYTGTNTVFKAGVVTVGANAGFNMKNWVVDCNPPLTGLAGGTYTYRVYDSKGCYADATITVAEIAPATAPANIRKNTDPGKATARITDLGQPTFATSSSNRIITNNAPASGEFPIGTTTVLWTVIEGSEVTTLQQAVIVEDKEAPQVSGTTPIAVNTDAGAATATVTLIAPAVSDNSGGVVTISHNAPATFPIGNTIVTWTARDASGNLATTTQLVTVSDAEAPAITAPADKTVSTDAGVSFATIMNIGTATASDNAGNVTISKSTSATQFGIGLTVVTWTARDAAGNTATATQNIIVVDNESPRIIAPADITAQATGNGFATGVILGNAIVSDNSGNATVSNNAPASFPVGTTVVTWTATDASGNSTSATQIVTVSNCTNYSVSVASQPTSTLFTGGDANVLYLGYGAQSTKLQVSVPTTGGPYTFQWNGAGLNSSSSSAPIFTPTAAGIYNFTVKVLNSNGCEANGFISICVRDARVLNSSGNWDGKKVYVCHVPPGNPSNPQLLSVSVNAVAAHITGHAGDRLGQCNQTCAAPVAARKSAPAAETFAVKLYPNPSADFFRLQVKTADTYTRITVKVVDAFGRTVEVFNNVTADKVLNFGDKYASGAYFAEVVQGEERKMIPLVKTK